MLKHLFAALLSFIVIGAPLCAQVIITGNIKAPDGKPLENITVIAARQADSSVLKTGFSDKNGHYTLSLDNPGPLIVKATAVHFDEQYSTCAPINKETSTVDFVLIPATKQLDAVTVITQKPLLERRADRTIFNVAASVSAIGSNALETIKKAPGVLVRQQDNSIVLAGKNTVSVLIDDRLVQLSGEDLFSYLQSIPSDQIDRIEVITSPPAKYDAAGNSGLINIVLKKNHKNGVNGDLRTGYEQSGYGTAIGGGNLNIRKGRLNLYANGSYSNGAKNILEQVTTYFPDQAYLLRDPYKRAMKTLQYTVGADLQLHQTGVLGIQFTGSTLSRRDDGSSDIIITHRPGNDVDSVVHSTAISTRKNTNNLLNINYVWSIDTTGRKLTLNANRLWFESDRNRDYKTDNYYGWYLQPTGVSSRNRNTGAQQIAVTAAQADLELPYKWANVSLGGKISSTENNSNNKFLYYDQGQYLEDTSVSNEFRYKERVAALYASLSKTAGKWDFQAGLRGEYTQTDGYSVKLAQDNQNTYFNLFPTAYLQYRATGDHVFTANYSRRIDRPGYRALDPYRSYSSPYSYLEGNPFLKPALIHNLELAYTFKGKYSCSFFYQYNPGTFGQVFFVDAVQKITYVRTENYGDFHNYGVNVNASFNPVKPLETEFQASGYLQQVNTTYTGREQTGNIIPGFYITWNNSISLNRKKTLVVQANIFYIGQYLNDVLLLEPQCNLDTGIKAMFLDRKLVVSISSNDLLGTLKAKGMDQVTGQTLNSYFDERNVRLTINYKFGSNSIKEQRQRRTGAEEENKRM